MSYNRASAAKKIPDQMFEQGDQDFTAVQHYFNHFSNSVRVTGIV